jgi:hypothetical protein
MSTSDWLYCALKESHHAFTQKAPLVLSSLTWPTDAKTVLRSMRRADIDLVGGAARSECNPFLTKYCLLYDEASDIEIRINHYYRHKYEIDSVHNHKWKFLSLLLRGRVDHYIFPIEKPNPDSALVVQHKAGDVYLMPEDLSHCFLPTPNSLTLMMRGPRSRATWSRTSLDKDTFHPTDETADAALRSERRMLSVEEYQRFLFDDLDRLLENGGPLTDVQLK